MLEVRDIHTYYGGSYVLQGVSLKAEQGSVVAVLGRNGMGKTTLMRSIIGFTPPRRGQLWFKVWRSRAAIISHRPDGDGDHSPGPAHLPLLSVRENLAIATRRHGVRDGRCWPWSGCLACSPAPGAPTALWQSLSPAVSSRCWPRPEP